MEENKPPTKKNKDQSKKLKPNDDKELNETLIEQEVNKKAR